MNDQSNFEYMKFQYRKENLHNIFATTLDIFPNIKDAHVIGQICFWELLQKIKYNLAYDITVNTILTHKYINKSKNPLYDQIKENLPVVCFNANFNSYKSIDNLISPTNLMFLDIDDFNNTEEALSYKNQITLQYDWIIACNLSLSRLGLHVIISVDKINNNDDFNNKYDFISKVYFNDRLDKNGKSLARYTVVPFDFNIYINESPNVLNIEHIMKFFRKGISSVYKEEKIISTAYTFSPTSGLNSILNDSARKDGLKFRVELDESLFLTPDIPVYYPEGLDVIKVNLRPYHDRKVMDGFRTATLGCIAVKMIYLNAELNRRKDNEIREAILKLLIKINKEICDPPLHFKEVLNSFNANWKKYEDDALNYSIYYEKQRSFWSRECTLKGNEKRRVTCKIKNEPVVADSKRKIREAIETLKEHGMKVTQKAVAEESGMQLPTIKKYRDYYNELLNKKEMKIDKNCSTLNSHSKPAKHEILIDYDETINLSVPNLNSDTRSDSEDILEIGDSKTLDVEEDTLVMFGNIEFAMTEEKIHEVYDRIFDSLKSRLDEHQGELLYNKFVNRLNNLSQYDLKLLAVNINDINDSTTYFKQSALDFKFWDMCDDLILEKS